MHQSGREPTPDEASPTDPGANGQVNERVEPLRGPPPVLAQRGGIDVGVECHRYAHFPADNASEIRICPSRLRRTRDEPPRFRIRIEVDRPERSDADGLKPGLASLLPEKINRPL